MIHDVLVPLDGSDDSARALGPASALARYLGSRVVVLALYPVGDDAAKESLAISIERQLQPFGPADPEVRIEPCSGPVGERLAWIVNQAPGRLVCLSSHGRGRSAGVVGSVASDLLDGSTGPLLLVGPGYTANSFRCHGPLLVAVTDDDHAKLILPIAEAFAVAFDYQLELVTVGAEDASWLQPLADEVAAAIGDPVSTSSLAPGPVAQGLIDRAEEEKAALVAMATHNPSGARRLLLGSTMADVLHRSPCPVLTIRPAEPGDAAGA